MPEDNTTATPQIEPTKSKPIKRTGKKKSTKRKSAKKKAANVGTKFGPMLFPKHSVLKSIRIPQTVLENKVLVAELTGRNPNVLYELGLAQALHKPVVLISFK